MSMHIFDRRYRRARIERDAGLLAERLDRLQRAMQMRAGLRMHRDVIAAGFRERLEIGIAGRDHQMRVEDLLRVRPQRLDDVGTVGDVRHEMPVHHVEMDPVGAGRVDRADLVAEFRKVRRQDRRRDDERTRGEGHGRLSEGRTASGNMQAEAGNAAGDWRGLPGALGRPGFRWRLARCLVRSLVRSLFVPWVSYPAASRPQQARARPTSSGRPRCDSLPLRRG